MALTLDQNPDFVLFSVFYNIYIYRFLVAENHSQGSDHPRELSHRGQSPQEWFSRGILDTERKKGLIKDPFG